MRSFPNLETWDLPEVFLNEGDFQFSDFQSELNAPSALAYLRMELEFISVFLLVTHLKNYKVQNTHFSDNIQLLGSCLVCYHTLYNLF